MDYVLLVSGLGLKMCNKTDAVLIPNRNTPLRVVLGTTELAINCLGLILNLALCVVLLKTQMLLIISKMLIMNSIIASVIALSTRYFAALHMLSEDRLFDGWLLEGSIFIHNCALMMTTINEVVLVCVCWATLCWNKKFCKRTLWIMGTTFCYFALVCCGNNFGC
ncbi:hypothetical protein M3Y94_01006500 [Aphelenchoides besseyi]|nr:hypothetical protein M3Y94_01006500 [Aphelenchoides besseyi]